MDQAQPHRKPRRIQWLIGQGREPINITKHDSEVGWHHATTAGYSALVWHHIAWGMNNSDQTRSEAHTGWGPSALQPPWCGTGWAGEVALQPPHIHLDHHERNVWGKHHGEPPGRETTSWGQQWADSLCSVIAVKNSGKLQSKKIQ